MPSEKERGGREEGFIFRLAHFPYDAHGASLGGFTFTLIPVARSAERRYGYYCGSGWAAFHYRRTPFRSDAHGGRFGVGTFTLFRLARSVDDPSEYAR